jgi:hypothetical protein
LAGSGAPHANDSRFTRFLAAPRLGLWLCALAVILTTPALFTGFCQDDWVGRYIYSDLPGASDLYHAYAGGYGISNGVPADNHWQMEQGHAPWWTYPNLRLALFRPVSLQGHFIDAALWPDSAVGWHAHSLLWFGILVLAATRMYRFILGPAVGGMAALLFALDYTHGFTVAYVTNRHALISATFGILCLDQHFRSRALGDKRALVLASILYTVALFCGELSITVFGYLFAYALFADTGRWSERALSLLPYLVITVVWRIIYVALGYGAFGSGVYVDITREPLRFLVTLLERGPILLLGQFFYPPAEITYVADARWTRLIWIGAVVFLVALSAALAPLFRRKRLAWVWLVGLLGSLVPASSTFPHSRQLMFTSIGAMALLAQLLHLHAVELRGQAIPKWIRVTAIPGAIVITGHLFISPLVLPFHAGTPALAGVYHRAIAMVGDDVANRDAIFVNAPDYLAVRIAQLMRRVNVQPLPRRWRGLAAGPQPLLVRRSDDRTLIVSYEGGLLNTPLSQLYRDSRLRMPPGHRVALAGMTVEVRALTEAGLVQSAAFHFDRSLDDDQFRFYYWGDDGFAPFRVPGVGQSTKLAGPVVKLGL